MMEALPAILLLFVPLAFGAVEAWSELLVLALAAMMSVCSVSETLSVRSVLPICPAHGDLGKQSRPEGMVLAARTESDQVREIDCRVREPLWPMCRRPQRGVSVL
jgi:hypothetical protein